MKNARFKTEIGSEELLYCFPEHQRKFGIAMESNTASLRLEQNSSNTVGNISMPVFCGHKGSNDRCELSFTCCAI